MRTMEVKQQNSITTFFSKLHASYMFCIYIVVCLIFILNFFSILLSGIVFLSIILIV